jgi:hypothetical protein
MIDTAIFSSMASIERKKVAVRIKTEPMATIVATGTHTHTYTHSLKLEREL